jgi:hypothetical protein
LKRKEEALKSKDPETRKQLQLLLKHMRESANSVNLGSANSI